MRPSLCASVTHELKSCKSAVFDQNWVRNGSKTGEYDYLTYFFVEVWWRGTSENLSVVGTTLDLFHFSFLFRNNHNMGWSCKKSTHSIRRHDILSHKLRNEWGSERASDQMSAAERASVASSAEHANEWAVRVNEQMEEHMAQYSTRRFHILFTHCGAIPSSWNKQPLRWKILLLLKGKRICWMEPKRNRDKEKGIWQLQWTVSALNRSLHEQRSSIFAVRYAKWIQNEALEDNGSLMIQKYHLQTIWLPAPKVRILVKPLPSSTLLRALFVTSSANNL